MPSKQVSKCLIHFLYNIWFLIMSIYSLLHDYVCSKIDYRVYTFIQSYTHIHIISKKKTCYWCFVFLVTIHTCNSSARSSSINQFQPLKSIKRGSEKISRKKLLTMTCTHVNNPLKFFFSSPLTSNACQTSINMKILPLLTR